MEAGTLLDHSIVLNSEYLGSTYCIQGSLVGSGDTAVAPAIMQLKGDAH